MYAGLALTVLGMLVVFVDQVAVHGTANHLRAVYADYNPDQAASDYSMLATYLYVVGTFGVGCWLWMIWAAKRHKRGTRVAATVIFVLASAIAVTNLVAQEYGSTVLPAPLGIVGTLPCLAGLIAVVLLWKGGRTGFRVHA